jgi:hypothetical protein
MTNFGETSHYIIIVGPNFVLNCVKNLKKVPKKVFGFRMRSDKDEIQ